MHFLQHIMQLFITNRSLNWEITCLIITSQLEPCQLDEQQFGKKGVYFHFYKCGIEIKPEQDEVEEDSSLMD
jgi:hypothetical protein